MKTTHLLALAASLALTTTVFAQGAQPKAAAAAAEQQPVTLAIFPFEERGEGLKDAGDNVSKLIFVALSQDPKICLVERELLKKVIDEHCESLSGAVDQQKAITAGNFVGAKLLVTGSVFKVAGKTNIVAKVIGTETTKVLGCGVDGAEPLDELGKKLAASISDILAKKSASLLPAPMTEADVIETLKQQVGDAKRVKVFVSCAEQHIGQPRFDPAVETELKRILLATGFEVLDNAVNADVVIKGEGFSETTMRKDKFFCAKGRVELNATTKSDVVLCSDKQVGVGIDAAEGIAGKQALENAANKLALRLIPKIVTK